LVYELDKNLKPIRLAGAIPPLNGRFLYICIFIFWHGVCDALASLLLSASWCMLCERARCMRSLLRIEICTYKVRWANPFTRLLFRLEIPTGIPLVYELDKNLKPIRLAGAIPPLNGRFLADVEALKKAQEEVANQSKLRYGLDKE